MLLNSFLEEKFEGIIIKKKDGVCEWGEGETEDGNERKNVNSAYFMELMFLTKNKSMMLL